MGIEGNKTGVTANSQYSCFPSRLLSVYTAGSTGGLRLELDFSVKSTHATGIGSEGRG